MRRKLLLADDSVTIQRVIELTFADEDVEVVAVGDGKKAIASIEQDRPDIVLADVGMPERDGYEVAAFIKGNPHLATIPVLLLTGAFEPIDETRARAVGCDGVLVKPFEPQMVINRVKDLLAGRRPAGLWSASPTAQGPTRHSPVPQPDHGVRAAAAPPGSGASLEDYFDRLDAAFANLDASHPDAAADAHTQSPAVEAGVPPEAARAAAPQPARRDEAAASAPWLLKGSSGLPADVLDGWDPDLTGDPKRVEPVVTAAPPTPVAPPEVDIQEPPSPPAFVPARTSSHVQTPMPSPSPPPTPAPSPAPAPPPMPSQAAPISPAPQMPTPATPPAATMPPASSVPPAPVALPIGPSVVSPPHEAPAVVSASSVPSLAEAFSALLSAEQSRAISPSAVSAPGLSNAALEDIVRRVVARMSDDAIRDTVVDIAERLVREEIERIKRTTQNL